MKKILFVILGMFVCLGHTTAEDKFVVTSASVLSGGKGYVEIALNNDVTTACPGFQFELVLPSGVVATGDFQEGSRLAGLSFTTSVTDRGEYYQVLSYQSDVVPMSGTEGGVIGIVIQADASIAAGQNLSASLRTLKITNADAVSILVAETQPFEISVTDRVILDESSEYAPVDQEEVNVTVNRTLKKDKWSTICLPFDMDANQISTAFGDDALLADFVGCEVGSGAETLTVQFTEWDPTEEGIYANYPYLIKVTRDISSFDIDNVTIESDEGSAKNTVSVGKGKNKKDYSFVGTLHANIIPENGLFLSNNKFYYSAGQTAIKAFRGYFVFADVLAGVGEVKLNVVDPTTRINSVDAEGSNEAVYDLSGRRIVKPQQRGIYIVNGKKVAK